MRTLVSRAFEFESAHQLTHGPVCTGSLHWHTYSLLVTIEGPIRPVEPGMTTAPTILPMGRNPFAESRMALAPSTEYASNVGRIIDNAAFMNAVWAACGPLDRRNIAEVWPNIYPTFDLIAEYLAQRIIALLADTPGCEGVRFDSLRLSVGRECITIQARDR